TASIAPVVARTCSPVTSAITAAIAPSVEMTGATIPTFPVRSAAYAQSRPATLPPPASASQPTSTQPSPAGIPLAATSASAIASPTSITPASSDGAPISRVPREDESVAAVKKRAAPRPPTIAIIGSPGLDQPQLAAAGDGFLAIARVELPVDPPRVRLDRVQRDVQRVADLALRQRSREQTEDRQLALSQLLRDIGRSRKHDALTRCQAQLSAALLQSTSDDAGVRATLALAGC